MNRAVRICLLAALASACLGACSSQKLAPAGQAESYQLGSSPAGDPGQAAARAAVDMVGAPYRYGGDGPRGFDCSGLVVYAYRAAGLGVPRTSAQQHRAARSLSLKQARPGDLLFFRYGGQVSHVGIYLGDQRFVHAPSSGRPVSVASLREAHYRERFVGAGRIVPSL